MINNLLRKVLQKLDNPIRTLSEFSARRLSYAHYSRRIYALLPENLRKDFWWIAAFSVVRALAESFTIFVISMFTRSVASPSSLRAGRVYQYVVEPLLPSRMLDSLSNDRNLIIAMCSMVVVFIIGKNAVIWMTTAIMSNFSERVGIFFTRRIYASFFAKDYLWHISPLSKDMISRMEKRGFLVALFASYIQIGSSIICGGVMFGILLGMDFWLTSMILVIFSIACCLIYITLRKQLEAHGKKIGEIEGRLNWTLRTTSKGMREILIYRKQDVFLEHIIAYIREAMPHKAFLSTSGSIPAWLLEILGFVVILGAMTFLVYNGRPMPMIVSAMSMLLLTAWRVLPIVGRIMRAAVKIRGIQDRAIACLELMESLAREERKERSQSTGTLPCPQLLELRSVRFRYPRAKSDALGGISLAIRQGEQIGLIGKSGMGKSTLGMLFAGLLLPTSGEILADGVEITGENCESYRTHIGYVPQSPLILAGTIADNIALADWGKPNDMDKISSACNMAAIDFLKSGKMLRTIIGNGSDGLSGGEIQRISIARALYTQPKIIVFDEATSSLDHANENRINDAVASFRGKIVSIVIAHRLSSVKHCDRIVWLDRGKIKMEGTPEEILPKYEKSLVK